MKYKITLFFLLISFLTFSQIKKGDDFFKYYNFDNALEAYLEAYEENKEDTDLNYKIGVCYLNFNTDKSLAINYLKVAVKSDDKPEAEFLLARAYHYAYQFDKAIEHYQIYRNQEKGIDENKNAVARLVEQCQNGKELMKFPINVTFTNLGKKINSYYDDYYPFIPADESFILFNSKRDDKSTQKDNGEYFANIYISKERNGEFKKASLVQKLNKNSLSNEVVGLTNDGKNLIYYNETFRGVGDLHLVSLDEQATIIDNKVLDNQINSKYAEISGCLSSDGKRFYFASDREGGYGGTDIYYCQKLPNGKWSEAINIGPIINTEYDEDFPNLGYGDTVLYFSSKGHSSMGGYDIFKASWDNTKKNFVNVTNIGYPINTPEDNMNFSVSENGKYGYISAVREGGYGGTDIYRVDFNEVEPKYTVIQGKVIPDNQTKVEQVLISIYTEDGELYGDYKPNLNTMKYVVILPAGKYVMEVESDGYKPIRQDIDVQGKGSYKPNLTQNIYLKR